MKQEVLQLKNDEETIIACDPYRYKIRMIFVLSEEPLTVKQVAVKMGEVPAKVHYHVQKLLKIGFLELVKTETIRGIVAKYYTNKYMGVNVYVKDLSDKVAMRYGKYTFNNVHTAAYEQFQESLVLTDLVMKNPEDIDLTESLSAFQKVYLTEEERLKFIKDIEEIVKKHMTPVEGKREYGFIGGITRRT